MTSAPFILKHPEQVAHLRGETVVQAKQHLRRYEDHVLVEEVLHQGTDAQVIPVPVYQQGLLQEHELGEREVGGHRGLPTFLPQNPDAHVRFLYHGHIVAAVADGCCVRTAPCSFYQMHDLDKLAP